MLKNVYASSYLFTRHTYRPTYKRYFFLFHFLIHHFILHSECFFVLWLSKIDPLPESCCNHWFNTVYKKDNHIQIVISNIIFFPSSAVVRNFRTTESLTGSPSSNICFIYSLIFDLLHWYNLVSCCCVSHTVSSSILTSIFVCPSSVQP